MGGAGPAVIPQGYGYRPVPIQSASPAGAPGGPAAPPSAPTPVQTQMPPLDASACTATQTFIPPGGTFTSGPLAGQVTATGGCQDNPTGFSIAQIPWWGWGLGVVALVLIARPGGKR
jgi:hypothetical protein